MRPEDVLAQGEDVLGTYEPVASPARITLHWDRIGGFFWHNVIALRHAGVLVEKRDLKRLATVAVYKTYAHERFHLFCDVARHLFGGGHDRMKEEALAVASSYHAIEAARGQWNAPAGLLGEVPYRLFMRRIFAYSAPGYRDWRGFQLRNDFEDAVAQYLVPDQNFQFLTGSGVDVALVLAAMRNGLKSGAAIEQLVP
jgi:hypothetical protein